MNDPHGYSRVAGCSVDECQIEINRLRAELAASDIRRADTVAFIEMACRHREIARERWYLQEEARVTASRLHHITVT